MNHSISRVPPPAQFTPITVTITLGSLDDLKELRDGLGKCHGAGTYSVFDALDIMYKELK